MNVITSSEPLSPTSRTVIHRGAAHAVAERDAMLEVLRLGLVAHVGFSGGTHPVVLPMAYAVDPVGPDRDGTLYLHGSVAAAMLRPGTKQTMCATITLLDGLVAARSGFHHSMNYRCVVVIGAARRVTDADERGHALDLIVDQMLPGRSGLVRAPTRKELAATAVLGIPLHEASLKTRAGGPVDDPADADEAIWAGHIPLSLAYGDAITDPGCVSPIPDHVAAVSPTRGQPEPG